MHSRLSQPQTLSNRTRLIALACALVISLMLAACGTEAAPPAPTRAPAPTFTSTPEGQQPPPPPPVAAPANDQPAGSENQPTEGQPAEGQPPPVAEAPTDTPVPPPTDTPASASAIINIDLMNIRGGPGINYNIVGGARSGDRFPIKGKNQAGDWWQIDFNGQDGWVFGELVRAENVQAVAIAQNIPQPPPPTNTPIPPPTQPPPPPPTQPPAAPPPEPVDNFPFILLENTARCDPNAGTTYFNGFVRYRNNEPRNAVCVQIDFYGPRNTKCSGCDGVGNGVWGFSPFGGPAPPGTTVEIYIVGCDGTIPAGGRSNNFGNLTPQSKKWVHTVNESEQCTGITFVSQD